MIFNYKNVLMLEMNESDFLINNPHKMIIQISTNGSISGKCRKKYFEEKHLEISSITLCVELLESWDI